MFEIGDIVESVVCPAMAGTITKLKDISSLKEWMFWKKCDYGY